MFSEMRFDFAVWPDGESVRSRKAFVN